MDIGKTFCKDIEKTFCMVNAKTFFAGARKNSYPGLLRPDRTSTGGPGSRQPVTTCPSQKTLFRFFRFFFRFFSLLKPWLALQLQY